MDRLIANLPDSYATAQGSGNYVLLNALAESLDALSDVVDTFRKNRFLETATGRGLDRAAENYNVFRPPGMTDARFSALARAIVGASRGTLATIKEVFEAATGYTNVTVQDQQLYTGTQPAPFEIRIGIPVAQTDSFGRGFYPGLPTDKDGYPLKSGLAGVVLDEVGFPGGKFNDHVWSLIDVWTKDIMDRVRLAGTYYTFVAI